MSLKAELLSDSQGKKFVGLFKDPRLDFDEILAFFEDEGRQRRLIDAAAAGKTALEGVIAELEGLPAVDRFFRGNDVRETKRLRQAIGVIVRILMDRLGWERAGRKGYLGRRARVAAGISWAPGEPYNESGPSRWFNRAENYRLPTRVDSPQASTIDGGPGPRREADHPAYAERVRRGLDSLLQIGTDEERRETCEALMTALAETRREQGRPF